MVEYFVIGFFLFFTMAVLTVLLFVAIAVKNHLSDLKKVLEYKKDPNQPGTVLLPVTKMNLDQTCTTVLPLPMGAELCHHTMDVVTKEIIKAPHEEKSIVILQCNKCGAIDKTITATSKIPEVPKQPIPRSECRHHWVKEKSVTMSSAYEQMEELLLKKENKKDFDPGKAPAWMFRKTLVKERVCSNCGEIDRVVTANFDGEEAEEITNNEVD